MRRLFDAARELRPEQRLAALSALGLFVSMLLPWYSETSTLVEHNAAKAGQVSLSAFQAFSFVEAAVLLVSTGVLAMLFARAEQREFKLPGGDGLTVMVAGGWTALLIFYRLLDKPGLHGNQRFTSTVGVEWGIFVALLLALGLAYAGSRMRGAEHERRSRTRHQVAEPPPPGPDPYAGRARMRDVREEDVTVLAATPAGRANQQGAAATPRARDTPRATPEDSVRRADAEEPVAQEPARAAPAPAPAPARSRPRYPPAPGGQMSFEDPPGQPD
jgi:hypothetical protein